MEFEESLLAVSPIDGRYHNKTKELSAFFSEAALIKSRVIVEAEYFTALCHLPLPQLANVTEQAIVEMKHYAYNLSLEDVKRVKEIEMVTNHDVKAIEYLLKEYFDKVDALKPYKEFIHFGLTSQDINNTAMPMLTKQALEQAYLPLLEEMIDALHCRATEWADIPMLAKTHGQPASPTRLGKELYVFVYRLEEELKVLKTIPVKGKFGGATGNLNAHHVAYPDIDWPSFANDFLENHLGIKRESFTTQISNYDSLAALMDSMRRINTIMIDMNRDIWQYNSMEYFKQSIKPGEVGSSAMPHKVNPIDFENAEGNLGMANAILTHLSTKLPISRLQRDLTDSTVLRNLGVPFGHILIAIKSSIKGLGKLLLNEKVIRRDLDGCWNVVAEAIQTILRREGYPNPYEALKALTRTNESVTADTIAVFVDQLEISDEVKKELKKITPFSYTGM
ncbi:MAG: adenylosuccinate lyase [Bacteroidaceae bacterium]